MKELIERYQSRLLHAAPTVVPDAGPTRACPFCAETIRAAAVLCRFCGRELT